MKALPRFALREERFALIEEHERGRIALMESFCIFSERGLEVLSTYFRETLKKLLYGGLWD